MRRIVSCILPLYLLLAGVRPGAAQSNPADPDALYRLREDPAQATAAADIWSRRADAGGPGAFDAAWKLARACYWLGTEGPADRRREWLERGITAATQAAAMSDARPEGHYWLAANMGALAESFGVVQGIKYRGRIKQELERVLAIDPAWLQGSADRALGWWYHRVPGLFGGSEAEAEQHLRRALTYAPESTATLYFLGEVRLDRHAREEAVSMFERVRDAPLDPDWAPEDRAFKRRAAERLRELTGARRRP